MARSNEPLLWSLFSVGGVVAALFGPVIIVLIGLAGPLGLFSGEPGVAYDRLRDLVSSPIVRIALFVIIVPPMFHWAHRFRFTLVDLGLRGVRRPIAVLCYGIAIAVTLAAAIVLWRL